MSQLVWNFVNCDIWWVTFNCDCCTKDNSCNCNNDKDDGIVTTTIIESKDNAVIDDDISLPYGWKDLQSLCRYKNNEDKTAWKL